ncbi:PEP-CTERM sorting domain-containing protein [Phenylobacterium sp.]|uniref:PEP-CTERM sorting domain-containing protein n=1 Tax=Phenylobacterium sp. TaxID=1871053 RepID=UPI0025D39D14|nr:PEP-CTERM sorting domain-containing protein [Phenylobacterium sp.]
MPGAGLAFNSAESGLLLSDLVDDNANLHTLSLIGTPATVFELHETGLAFVLAHGAIGDPGNPVLAYDGPGGGYATFFVRGGQRFDANHSTIYRLTGASLTRLTSFDFAIDHGAFGAPAGVPEPGAWSLMILGCAAAGAMLRRRTRPTVSQRAAPQKS